MIMIGVLVVAPLIAGFARTATAIAPDVAAKQSFEFRIDQRKLTGGNKTIRILKGDSVEMRWNADEAMTIHIHGYNAEVRVMPGTPAVMRFDAYATGRYPVEAHPVSAKEDHASHRGGITLLYLEVHPR